MLRNSLLLFSLFLGSVSGLRSVAGSLCMKASDDILKSFKTRDFSTAFRTLKRNPSLKIDRSDGLMLLNNMERTKSRSTGSSDTLSTVNTYVMDGQMNDQEIAEAYAFIYTKMKNQNLLRGFNCLEGEYPISGVTEVTPKRIYEETGKCLW